MMLVSLLLSLSISTIPTLPEVKNAEAPQCPVIYETTARAIYESLDNSDLKCRMYAVGYIEGHFDLGVSLIFNPPNEDMTLGKCVNIFRMFYAVHPEYAELPAWRVLGAAFVNAWGRYDSTTE